MNKQSPERIAQSADIMQTMRERRLAAGLKRIELWVPKESVKWFRAKAKAACERKGVK